MILSVLGCAVALLGAQQQTPASNSPAPDSQRILDPIRSYAEDHGSGYVPTDDNLSVQTQVTAIDSDHISYKLVMAAREANRSRLEHAETTLGFDWKNAYALQVDASDELGSRVTVFLKKPVTCSAWMTPKFSNMTTTMVLNERAMSFSKAPTTQIDECYFWFGTREESNNFRDLLIGVIKKLGNPQVVVIHDTNVREVEYGLPDDNAATWRNHKADALLDGVVPYESKVTGAEPLDGAEVLAVGPSSQFKAGEVITGIHWPGDSQFTVVHKWTDVRKFLAKGTVKKAVVECQGATSAKPIDRTVDLTFPEKKTP
jgi:hypothetical protein